MIWQFFIFYEIVDQNKTSQVWFGGRAQLSIHETEVIVDGNLHAKKLLANNVHVSVVYN